MKTYHEMSDSVFTRSRAILDKKEQKIKRIKSCCILLILFSAAGILIAGAVSRQKSPDSSVASKTDEENRTESKDRDETSSLATESENASSVTKPSDNPFISAGEFAADMHRPEGYHRNIGSSLALMMYWNPEPETRFSVLLHGLYYNGTCHADVLETVSKINETISDKIIISEENRVSVLLVGWGDDETLQQMADAYKYYHVYLTADQITRLAENDIKCLYLGSGGTNYEDMNWDTKEGIRAYCEIHGDGCILSEENVVLWKNTI